MKRTLLALAPACAILGLGGCQSFSLEGYAKAANDLDPDCYKSVHIDVKPLLLPGWVVPVVTGSYDKVCNPDQAGADGTAGAGPLIVGRAIGGPP